MKTMAGVALAAVVGACALAGGVGRAEATTIRFDYAASDGFRDFAKIKFTSDVTNSPSTTTSGITRYRVQASGIGDSSSDNGGIYSSFTYNLSQNNNGSTNVYVYLYGTREIRDEDYTVSLSGNFTVNRQLTYSSSFSLTNVELKTFKYETGFIIDQYNGVSNHYDEYVLDQTPNSLSITQTPLPASAPMLGAALLVLGGFGYARRRSASA